MDRHPARFRCVGNYCYAGSRQSDQVFTWRGCVTHAIERHHYGRYNPADMYHTGTRNRRYHQDGVADFVRVPDIVEAQALRQPHDYPKAKSSSWVCGHCTKYVCQPGTLRGVIDHVGAVHGKTQVDAADILLAPGVFSISRANTYCARLGSQGNSKPVEEFFCFKCVESMGFGDIRRMTSHMHGRHEIKWPHCRLQRSNLWPLPAVALPAVESTTSRFGMIVCSLEKSSMSTLSMYCNV
ncbi:hypothetical protein B0H15DRAFT_873012 [Mycena belliarum]|uniref:Uncharacterized protein n=1 Tax=Mycena belliarum TaxID=1033014 RepID=A0AAD6XFG6_9AGAR|nr:hypothetical protein B0H15DRAFT_873012 [Mycena belliae]